MNLENSYSQLPAAMYAAVAPEPAKHPALLAWNAALADELGLRHLGRDAEECARIFSGGPLPDVLEDQLERRESADETAQFARELGRKVINHGDAMEQSVGPLLANWDLARVGLLERLILTIGLTELNHSPEVPYRVVINEGVNLARRFGAVDGHKYVNACLDKGAQALRAIEVQARDRG